ncbi:MAG TPA: carboxypeptidase M32 [Chloroflexota bacterium]|jgi:carboxypeptidase Taq
MSGSNDALDQLKATFAEIGAINNAISVLAWDQNTYMPLGGATGRAEDLAALSKLAHERLTSRRTGDLLKAAQDHTANLDPGSDDASLVRVARRDYDREVKVPDALVAEFARTSVLAESVWREARLRNDYPAFAPWVEKIVELNRRMCEYVGYPEQPFDALVDYTEPGMTTNSVRAVFDELRPQLLDLVGKITPQVESVDDTVLHRHYDEATQERIGREVVARFGYDFTRGRLDRTTHPFETAFNRDDVRITTRYDARFLSMALMGTMHEAGHGMYEQGISPALAQTPITGGVSAGMHESQSRLWENFVGRGIPFWRFFYPTLQAAFPGVLEGVDMHQFYRAINKVCPSLIRVEADEVTYCLHIMFRFELEIALLDGSLSVKDAPAAWNEKVRGYLGITPPNDTEGILQDIHWTSGLGGFQGYALGNIIAAQLWEAAHQAHPDLPEQFERGEFGPLLRWLNTNIHQYGRKFFPADLLKRATGSALSPEPYIRYLRDKYGQIYSL